MESGISTGSPRRSSRSSRPGSKQLQRAWRKHSQPSTIFAAIAGVLDTGGGTGSFLIAALRRYPALHGTLFELPGACAIARQRLSLGPEGARVTVWEGDFLKDPLPDHHDVLILANTMHVLSEANNIALLKNRRAHAARGAVLLLVDWWMDPTHTQPPAAPLASGEFLLISGEGQAYGEEDADQWLMQTGWGKLERRPLAGPASVIIAEAV